MPSGPDKELEKLEKEAERNGGDRTKIIAYKARLRTRPRASEVRVRSLQYGSVACYIGFTTEDAFSAR
jgi:hypothetical protein